MSLKVGDNIAKFMSRIPGIHRHREVVQPNLGLFVACADVNMGRLADFVGIEEGAIRTPAPGSTPVTDIEDHPRNPTTPWGSVQLERQVAIAAN